MNSITRIMSARLSGCLLAWLLAGPVQASLLLLDVTADRVNYSSLQGAAGQQTTAGWIPASPHPAHAWIPGQLDTIGRQTLSLSSSDGNTVDISLVLKGIVYGGISGFNQVSPPPGLGGSAGGSVQGNSYAIYSGAANAFASQMYQAASGTTTPFTLVRPIFDLNESAMLAALNGKPSGTYNGTLTVKYRYRVQYTAGGIWTYEVRPLVLTVQIRYLAQVLDSLTMVGNGVFTPKYTVHSTEVTGETSWTFNATGAMPAGIYMMFMTPPDKRFAMTKTGAAKGDPDLPYNLMISNDNSAMGGGSPNQLITNGVLAPGARRVVIVPTNGVEQLGFSLKASFRSDYVTSGTYSDQIPLMFGVVIE